MGPDVVYIHYGDDRFREPKPIRNMSCFTKPYGGLWASREGDRQGWKDWCEQEEYCLDRLKTYFRFKLKENAKVLELNCVEQLEDLPKLAPFNPANGGAMCRLDFEKLAKTYDAIELRCIWRIYWPLYGWDCNSILIMNPEIVDILNEDEK